MLEQLSAEIDIALNALQAAREMRVTIEALLTHLEHVEGIFNPNLPIGAAHRDVIRAVAKYIDASC